MNPLTIEHLRQYRQRVIDREIPDGLEWEIEVAYRIKKVNGKNRRILNKREHNPRYWIFETPFDSCQFRTK